MKNNKSDSLQIFVLLASVFIFIVLGITLYLGYGEKEGKRGTFGDMFGAANALFTGLSFVGLIVTILLQRKELKETREEITAQNSTLHLQKFESMFFNLLNARNEMISSYEKTYKEPYNTTPPEIFKGRRYIWKMYDRFLQFSNSDVNGYKEGYSKIYNSNEILSFFYRNLYQIIRLVDDHYFSEYGSEDYFEKKKYVDIIRDQLSDHEIAFLFYECIVNSDSEKLKVYMEEYKFFEFLSEKLIWPTHKSFYKQFNKTTP